MIYHRDVRDPTMNPVHKSTGHRQEVCGLRWSGDSGGAGASGSRGGVGIAGAMLASGGNDNKVCIWDLRGSRRPANQPGGAGGSASAGEDASGGDQPLWKFHEHTAAVKALAWDPHVSGVLATGGGTQDKTIRFWNVQNGTMLKELDTGSQVHLSPNHSSAFFSTFYCSRSVTLPGRSLLTNLSLHMVTPPPQHRTRSASGNIRHLTWSLH